ncbi:hypothetical protein [Geobacter sp. SVR]|uniref:hypothetical protein n=1 Tax=Geobacter sp. SVR TaxID=2495594 RepID=UPI00143EF920|nr:hypothetical protein [Geobacter sp. SVR]BCS55690.1 hypothetical protein GSVR_39980 [Geobacter sp. SVR]GCF83694.1 hypothetical protein GSbR_02940 [Geobacter sp. SVR]
MTTLSLRPPDDLKHEIEVRLRRQRFMEASLRVRGESTRINAEFEAIEDAPQ